MRPPAPQSAKATPELPASLRMLLGCAKMPVPIVRFRMRAPTVKGPSRWADVGERSTPWSSCQRNVNSENRECALLTSLLASRAASCRLRSSLLFTDGPASGTTPTLTAPSLVAMVKLKSGR